VARRWRPLVDELCPLSPQFAALRETTTCAARRGGVKHIRHPVLGPLPFEYSALAVDGRPVYPRLPKDADRFGSMIVRRSRSNALSPPFFVTVFGHIPGISSGSASQLAELDNRWVGARLNA
jgi:hypothetical protein